MVKIFEHLRAIPFSRRLLAVIFVAMTVTSAYTVLDFSGPAPVAGLTPSEIEVYPGEEVFFNATGSEGDIVSYAWHFHDGTGLQHGNDLSTITHAFANEGIYHITLFVNASNAKMDIANSKVVVKNYRPEIVLSQETYGVTEDEEFVLDASASTDDGQIESFKWDMGDGSILHGDTVTHSYRKSGIYTVNLTVKDDLDRVSFRDITVEVENPGPAADAGGTYNIEEGRPAFLDASGSTDNPSDLDGLRYAWSSGHIGKKAMEFYADDGVHHPYVTVTDDDDSSDTDSASVSVGNTQPKVAVDGAYVKGDLTLRVAGERWHNVELWFYRSGELYGYMNVTRGVSDPQTDTISNITFDLTEEWEIYAEYTPEDDPVNGQPLGATPAWVILDFEGGAYRWIQHAFNVVRPETHEWTVPLNQYFFKPECEDGPDIDKCEGNPMVHFDYRLYDQGADDLTVNWTFSDSYHEKTFGANGFPNFVVDEFTFTPAAGEMGDFNVTVTDDDGASEMIVFNMSNGLIANIAPRVEACDSVQGTEDSAVQFHGSATGSIGEDDFTFGWHFGDGQSGDPSSTQHTYHFSADYPVLLTASDASGMEGFDLTWAHIDNVPPEAVFTGPSNVNQDHLFTLDASDTWDTTSDEPYLEYAWDFGDGSYGYGEITSHLYTSVGTYTVELTVTDDDGAVSSFENEIEVHNIAPEAYVVQDALNVYGPTMEITLEGYGIDTFSDRGELEYSWNYNGGTIIGTGSSVTHTFENSGIYTVLLTVTDRWGVSDHTDLQVVVGVDSDIDSLTDEYELELGSDPYDWDTDHDHVADYWEIYYYHSDPTMADSSGSGLPDWFEISYLGYNVDTNGNGIPNHLDWDTDGDMIADGDEIELNWTTGEFEKITNPLVYNDPKDHEISFSTLVVNNDLDVSVAVDPDDTGKSYDIKIEEVDVPSFSHQLGPAFRITSDKNIKSAYIKARIEDDNQDTILYKYVNEEWIPLLKNGEITNSRGEYRYVWAHVHSFSIFSLGDGNAGDYDEDGLTDVEERGPGDTFYLEMEDDDFSVNAITVHESGAVNMFGDEGTGSNCIKGNGNGNVIAIFGEEQNIVPKKWAARYDVHIRMKADMPDVFATLRYTTPDGYTIESDFALYQEFKYYQEISAALEGSYEIISNQPEHVYIDRVFLTETISYHVPTSPYDRDSDHDGISDGDEWSHERSASFLSNNIWYYEGRGWHIEQMLDGIDTNGWTKNAEISFSIATHQIKTVKIAVDLEINLRRVRIVDEVEISNDHTTIVGTIEGEILHGIDSEWNLWIYVFDYVGPVSAWDFTAEVLSCLNPLNKDTDGDGLEDGIDPKPFNYEVKFDSFVNGDTNSWTENEGQFYWDSLTIINDELILSENKLKIQAGVIGSAIETEYGPIPVGGAGSADGWLKTETVTPTIASRVTIETKYTLNGILTIVGDTAPVATYFEIGFKVFVLDVLTHTITDIYDVNDIVTTSRVWNSESLTLYADINLPKYATYYIMPYVYGHANCFGEEESAGVNFYEGDKYITVDEIIISP